ncbi:MAG: class I SAM-dependent methyltransferase [Eudoraea sp.]|nr:class I SAM-dependent methyltransferase [Eudoraea sp.]
MSKEYDEITAFHYAAYRPSLHSRILSNFFAGNSKYALGLDVGCGTGHSSIAIVAYCKKVIGIDPSKDMLQRSLAHPGVEYILYDRKNLDFANDQFDIITFAGSLYYAKSQQLLNEIVRVCKDDARILVYDFEIPLDKILQLLKVGSHSKQPSEYDHQVNFSGLDQKSITLEKELSQSFSINISISNLSHLLLSSKDNYTVLRKKFGDGDLYIKVSQKLHTVLNSEKTAVKAMTYSTFYSVIK